VPILRDRPGAVGDFLALLMNDVRSGVFHPLPHTAFRFEDAAEALSCIARRKNIGKMVLSTIHPQGGPQ
jgi:NADPH:quinone reductase-like Zn-dependent oxidoreductase